MNRYRINIKSVYKNLEFSLFIIVAFFGVYFFLERVVGKEVNIFLLMLFFFSPLLVVVYLFVDYFLNSTKKEIRVFDDYIEVHSNSSNKEVIHREDLKEVYFYVSPSVYKQSSFQLLPFEGFHFLRITYGNDKKLYITSLSDWELFKNTKEYPIFKGKVKVKNSSIINSIFWNSI